VSSIAASARLRIADSAVNRAIERLQVDTCDRPSASLLVRLGIATSASPTGSMLVVTDDLHQKGTYRTFQSVPNLIPVGSG
jgi:hypothetical protein